jgi:hypothetical protein
MDWNNMEKIGRFLILFWRSGVASKTLTNEDVEAAQRYYWKRQD